MYLLKKALGSLSIAILASNLSGCSATLSRDDYMFILPKEILDVVDYNHNYVIKNVNNLHLTYDEDRTFTIDQVEMFEAESTRELENNGDTNLKDSDSIEKIRENINSALNIASKNTYSNSSSEILIDKNRLSSNLGKSLDNLRNSK